VPVVPTRRQLLITEPIAGVGPGFRIAHVIDANVYVRHERGWLMLGGDEPDRLQPDALPDDVAELPLDIGVLWRLAQKVSEQFPIFQDPAIRVAEHRGGLPTLTMDDRYLVGPLPGWGAPGRRRRRGTSPRPTRQDEAIAEWIVDGAPALDLSEISPRASPAATSTRPSYASAAATPTRLTTARSARRQPPRETASTVYLFGRISREPLEGVGS
jgi:hypothetical protein